MTNLLFYTLFFLTSCIQNEKNESYNFQEEIQIENNLELVEFFNVDNFSDLIAYSPDRCMTDNCMCEVSLKNNFSKESKVKTKTYIYSVYFSEGSKESEYMNGVKKFISSLPAGSTYTVVGHTDGCGNYRPNKDLSKSRALKVGLYVKKLDPTADVSYVGLGEEVAYHSNKAKRVDIIVDERFSILEISERYKADFYLIDMSLSMRGRAEMWIRKLKVNKKSNSRFFASYTRSCYNGMNIERLSPSGGTEIWYSYWKVLDYMKPGQTLLIISDFQSTVPLSNRERKMIEDKVRQKGISVKTARP